MPRFCRHRAFFEVPSHKTTKMEELPNVVVGFIRLNTGKSGFQTEFAKAVCVISRAFEVSGHLNDAYEFMCASYAAIENFTPPLCFQFLRIISKIEECSLWELSGNYRPNWHNNWSLSYENKDLIMPIGILTSCSINHDPVYYYLCHFETRTSRHSSQIKINTVIKFNEASRYFQHKKEELEMEIDFVRRGYRSADDVPLYERLIRGQSYIRNLRAADKLINELKESSYLQKLDRLRLMTEYADLIEEGILADEIEEKIK